MADAREVLARAIFELYAPGDPQWYPFEADRWSKEAEIMLAALSAAGLKVVGREPTEGMQQAMESCEPYYYADAVTLWQSAFDAAPPQPKESASE